MITTSFTRRQQAIAVGLLLFILALFPRVSGLADFATTDEAYHWIDRTARFSQAAGNGNWAATLQTGHPGVTLMWLGSVGVWLEALFGGAPSDVPPQIAHLAWLRLVPALFEALLVPGAYLLLRRLVQPGAAICAALLWATSPYLVAHSRLLHLDALLTSCVSLSLMLMLVACAASTLHFWKYLALSAICAGLALLTKGPALILLPFAGLTLFALVWHQARPATLREWRFVVVRVASRYLAWLAIALVVVVMLWPALWVIPDRALARYVSEIMDNGGRPNGDGQFFFGQAIADPGPLFYPVADLFRTTPAMLLGILAAPLAFRRRANRRTLLVLTAFVLFWTLIMSLGPKKFDRYVLPTWPALLVLAGSGLAAFGAWLAQHARRIRYLFASVALAALIVLEGAQLAWYHPYYLSYYNPLFGGGKVAEQVFLIGWGEGMDQVGAYLQSRPDLQYGPVLSALGATLQPFVSVDVRNVEDFGTLPANYAVVYLESIQRAANPALYERLQTTVPLHRVEIHGIEYARIYQLPRPYATPLDAQFGTSLRVRGVTVEYDASRIVVTPAWDVRDTPRADFHTFIHVLDAAGVRVAQIDVAPGGGDAPATTEWQPGQQIAVPLPIPLAQPLAPGTYSVVMGVYDVATRARLPLLAGPAAPAHLAGDHALIVAQLVIP